MVVEKATALRGGTVLVYCAIRERRRAIVLDAAALFVARLVVANIRAGCRERRMARHLDAAAVRRRGVPRN